MIRTVVKIDEDACTGCGLCVDACHESALALVDGVAKLVRDDYCDGLGNCLPVCPADAISFEEREAMPFDEKAVAAAVVAASASACAPARHSNGCPSNVAKRIDHTPAAGGAVDVPSQLTNWPIQIDLVNPTAAFLANADLLIAADCCAYAYSNFYADFMHGKVVMIGCPKLTTYDYSEKLVQVLTNNHINSLTVVRMEVPCCGGIQYAVERALQQANANVPLRTVTFSLDGKIL